MIVGIVVALPEELSTLTNAKIGKGDTFRINDKLLVALAGAGPSNARQASRLLLARGANALISWGCAAALTPNAKPGDLSLPDKIVKENAATGECDAAWVAHCENILQDALTIRKGVLAGSDVIIGDKTDKQALHGRTLAAALDMESHAVATAANEAGAPCLVIRAIADPADMSLPEAVCLSLTADGDVQLGVLLGHVLKHPTQISGLIKLGAHFNSAKKSLRSVAVNLDKITEFFP